MVRVESLEYDLGTAHYFREPVALDEVITGVLLKLLLLVKVPVINKQLTYF